MCNVTFWKDNDNSGRYKNLDGPVNSPDTSSIHWHDHDNDDMKDDISAIETDGNAWVQIYSSTNYGGRAALISPNSSVNLDTIFVNGDDMNDTIQSFQILDHKPIDTEQVIDNFIALYQPCTTGRNNDGKYYIDTYSQDSEYWVYYPEISINGETVSFSIDLSHRQAEQDDQAHLTFSMDAHGKFVGSIQVTYEMADATQIPDWMVTLIDDVIEAASVGAMILADGAEIVLTDGVGVVATVETDELIEDVANVLTFCVDHLNTVLSAIFKLQDDGGTMNFSAVVSQSIARAVLAYYQVIRGADGSESATYSMSSDNFLGSLQSSSTVSDVSDSWDNSKHTPYVTFTLNETDEEFRSFLPDASFFYGQNGGLMSSKIDYVDSLEKDDHLILQAVFDQHGNLFAVIGSIDLFNGSSADGYKAPTSGVLTYNSEGQIVHLTKDDDGIDVVNVLSGYNNLKSPYYDMLRQSLADTGDDYDITIKAHQNNLVNVSLVVIDAMKASIVM